MSTNLNGLNRRIEHLEQAIEALAPAPDDKPVVYIPDNSRDNYLAPGEWGRQFGKVVVHATLKEGTSYE